MASALVACSDDEEGGKTVVRRGDGSKRTRVSALDATGAKVTAVDLAATLGGVYSPRNAIAFVDGGPTLGSAGGPGGGSDAVLAIFPGGGAVRFDGHPKMRATVVRTADAVVAGKEKWCVSPTTCWTRTRASLSRESAEGVTVFAFATFGASQAREVLEKGTLLALEDSRVALRTGDRVAWLTHAKSSWTVDAKPIVTEQGDPLRAALASSDAVVSVHGPEIFVTTRSLARRYVVSGSDYVAESSGDRDVKGYPNAASMAAARYFIWGSGTGAPVRQLFALKSGGLLVYKGGALAPRAAATRVPAGSTAPNVLTPGATPVVAVPDGVIKAPMDAKTNWDVVKEIASENCAICHTAGGTNWGDPMAQASWRGEWKSVLLSYFQSATRPMPPLGTPWFDAVTPDKRALLVKFVNDNATETTAP